MATGDTTINSDFFARFARHLAHELNNPIGAISSGIFLIEDYIASAKDGSVEIELIAPFVGSIHEEADRLREVVQEFVAFAATTSLIPMPMDLTEFLGARTRDMARDGLPVTFEDGAPPARIMGDAGHLTVVLRSLVNDSVAAGATHIRLTGPQATAAGYTIHIIDDRAQIPSSHGADSAFDVNFERRGGGLGLQLPLAKKIVELHGGHLQMKTNAGHVDVTMTLPIASGDTSI